MTEMRTIKLSGLLITFAGCAVTVAAGSCETASSDASPSGQGARAGQSSSEPGGAGPNGSAGTSTGGLSDDGTCGDQGLPCCEGSTCHGDGLVCRSLGAGANICSRCGDPGDNCCAGSTCNGSGCCVNNLCIPDGAACGEDYGTCAAGQCDGCGHYNQICCGTSCIAGHECTEGICTPCGGDAESCCPADSSDARCTVGVCVPSGAESMCHSDCGAEGQACCDVATSTTGGCSEDGLLCNDNNECAPCGGQGEACCTGRGATACDSGLECADDVCTPCGGDGQSCCPAASADPRCVDGVVCVPAPDGSECHADCGASGQACCNIEDSSNGGCSEDGLSCSDASICEEG